MPQSLSAVYHHLVFSTKERHPFLADVKLRSRLHAFIASCSGELDCPALQVGGVADHVHVLARISREIAESGWVKELKCVSSRWIKTQGATLSDFQWQGGYAIFSVSKSNLDSVQEYVARQEEHHQRLDYQRELRTLLQRYGIEWDEHHLWD